MDDKEEVDVRYVRFMAHLGLVLLSIQTQIASGNHQPASHAQEIIEPTLAHKMLCHYIDLLIQWDFRELVASYSSRLPVELCNEKYAAMLQRLSEVSGSSITTSMIYSGPLSSVGMWGMDIAERRDVLAKAVQYDIDRNVVTRFAVDSLLRNYCNVCPGMILTSRMWLFHRLISASQWIHWTGTISFG